MTARNVPFLSPSVAIFNPKRRTVSLFTEKKIFIALNFFFCLASYLQPTRFENACIYLSPNFILQNLDDGESRNYEYC